jgi:hypothetical protein
MGETIHIRAFNPASPACHGYGLASIAGRRWRGSPTARGPSRSRMSDQEAADRYLVVLQDPKGNELCRT